VPPRQAVLTSLGLSC